MFVLFLNQTPFFDLLLICVQIDAIQTYLGNCSINAQCDSTQSLQCSLTNQTLYACVCAAKFYWSTASSQCTAQFTNAVSCNNTAQCRSDLGLYCDTTSTNKCICNSTFYWSATNICGTPEQKKTRKYIVQWNILDCNNDFNFCSIILNYHIFNKLFSIFQAFICKCLEH